MTCLCHQAIIGHVRKAELLNELESARVELLAALDGLSPEQMRMAGAVGVWSVKDVLAHIAAWQSELVTAFNQIQNKRVPDIVRIDDIDEWNEEQYHVSVRRSLEAIQADLEGVHRMLARMVADTDEKTLTDNRKFPWMEGEPLWYLVEENGTLHEREHAEEIRAWRDVQGF